MPSRHLLAALAVASLASGAPAAAAKPKPPPAVCHLLVDDKGDGQSQVGGPVLRSDAMDIHGADVATGKKSVVVVLRLATTKTDSDPAALLGLRWSVNFKVRGTRYTFERRRQAGLDAAYVYSAPGTGDPKVKETATEVRWEVPRAAIPELKKPGSVIENLAATGSVFTFNADAGASQRTYRDQTPSCLRPQ